MSDNKICATLNSIVEQFKPENLRHSWPFTTLFIVLFTIIFVLGIAGNLAVIFVYCRRRQMRSVTNMFIVNLAIADLFVILFCVPATLVSNIFYPSVLGSLMCRDVSYAQTISIFASAYSLAAISAERCKGIHSFKPVNNNLTKFQALVVIIIIWLAAFVTLVQWNIIFELTPTIENETTIFCVQSWNKQLTGDIYFFVGNLMTCYVLPGVLICVANSHVCLRVSNRQIPVGSASSKYVIKYHRKVKAGVKRLLIVDTFSFLLSWLPLYLVMCRVKFTEIESMSETEVNILDVLIPLVQLLGISNSCVNPICYAYMNSRFRKLFKSVFNMSACCRLSCFERHRQRTISQKSLIIIERNLRNNGRKNIPDNVKAQHCDESTGSSLISPRNDDLHCRGETQFFGTLYDRDNHSYNQLHGITYMYIRQEMRHLSFRLYRETSV